MIDDWRMDYPSGTIVRIVSERFGPATVGRIGTVTGNYVSPVDGRVYSVILEGSPAGTFHQCGAGDITPVRAGWQDDAAIRGESGTIADAVNAILRALDGGGGAERGA